MTDDEIKRREYDLVKEQADKAKREGGKINIITARNVKSWWEKKYNEKWVDNEGVAYERH